MSTWKRFTTWLSKYRALLIISLIILGILYLFFDTLRTVLAPYLSHLVGLWNSPKKPEAMTVQQYNDTVAYAKRKGYKPEWLVKVIGIETAGTFKTDIRNPISGAVGIFQFMWATLNGLGYSGEQVERMSYNEQFDLFDKHLASIGNPRITNEADLYFAIFYPAAIGKPDTYVLGGSAPARIARQNIGFDLNKDSKITVGEVKQYLKRY